MPRQYEKIRDGLLAIGYDRKAAQAKAAAIYNAQHPDRPVGGQSDKVEAKYPDQPKTRPRPKRTRRR
jgi:hypothetical protein